MKPYAHLNKEERKVIAQMLFHGQSLRSIAKTLGRSHATLSRELNRNRTRKTFYHPLNAQALARQRPGVDVPRRLLRRWRFQPRRSVGDDGFLWLSLGEGAHFDPATYRPIPSPAMLRDIARRLNLHDPSPERLAILLAIDELATLAPRVGPKQVLATLESLLGAEAFVAYWRETMKDFPEGLKDGP